MTRPATDRELDRLLAELPRETASPDFSRRVLRDLDRTAGERTRHRGLLAAAAAAVALAVGILLLPRSTPHLPVAETRSLQEEHRLLMEELEVLKASLRDSQSAPVLYLGGNEHLDLVLDLGPVWQGELTAGIRPAVYSGAERPAPTGERRVGERR
ncbi:MAG: hypothetical protein ACE5EG_05670 [Thermoanaerobaculia bacterium]